MAVGRVSKLSAKTTIGGTPVVVIGLRARAILIQLDRFLLLFELLPVPIPQQTLYARNDSTWRASFSSVW